MESFLITPVQPAQPHALPFRVFFEEYRQRRQDDLLLAAAEVFPTGPDAPLEDTTEKRLLAALKAQEDAYAALACVDAAIANGLAPATALDACLAVCESTDAPLKMVLHKMEGSALCLSGGGVRSASYCLGVLEGLSTFSRCGEKPDGLMDTLDYVSSVSGGGYIASWMMSWVYRRKSVGGAADWKTAYGTVISALAGEADVTAGDPEPQPVRHLRSYTSFLAPAVGLTLDTFTLVAIVLRNLFINWTMLIPVLFAVIALAKWSGLFFLASRTFVNPTADRWIEVAITILYLVAATAAATALPSHFKSTRYKVFGKASVAFFLGAVIAGSWLLTILPWPESLRWGLETKGVIGLIAYGVLAYSIWLAYCARVDEMRQRTEDTKMVISRWREKGPVLLLAALAAAVCSAMGSAVLLLLQRKAFPFLLLARSHPSHWMSSHATDSRFFLVFALPLVITMLLLSTSLFCALLGLFEMEEDREWWVRCGGCLLAFNLAWMVAHGLAFYGQGGWHRVIAGIAGLVLGLSGSLVGFSGVTSAGPHPVKAADIGKVGAFLQKHNLVLPTVSALAICLIALGMVAVEEAVRRAYFHSGAYGALLLFGISVVLAMLINYAININLFSLHGMYRMRLMRAFLGASNVARRPDPFTKFDPKDTPHETDLPSNPGAPLHVINTTLNLVGTKNMAWRQRKAESFSFSPIHCGGWRVGYVPTSLYGGARGVTVATAMSISGAAFDPNMGYQSSPLLSLLMTFFNLRLGCWLPNPKRPTPKPLTSRIRGFGASGAAFLCKAGPSFALRPLVEEALGQTDDTYRWIELTDGGHFENLALYEMVMRRCKRIVLVDAGADPHCDFEDLGNAIRKIRIDLGIPILFEPDLKMQAGMQAGNSYCAVATIDYGCVDDPAGGANAKAFAGTLVYIKASITGEEPADILQYAKTHSTFPHETTANQFFTEAQFESYRHLGAYAVSSIAGAPAAHPSMEAFTEAARRFWEQAGAERPLPGRLP